MGSKTILETINCAVFYDYEPLQCTNYF